jgi:hypothetical protein
MMLVLATPTEAGAMGAIGAIVLAAIHSKDFSSTGQKILIAGLIALGIGAMIGVFMSRGLLFKLAFVFAYFAVIWVCLEAVRIPELAQPDQAGLRDDHAPDHHGGVHPDRLDRFLDRIPRCLGRGVARAHLTVAARRGLGLPDLHQPLHLLPGVLPGFLRDRLSSSCRWCADRAEDSDTGGWRRRGADLVRRHALRQHADLVPASAVRLRAVLLRGVAPASVKSSDIYWGAVPWIGLQVIMVVIVIAFPSTGDLAAGQAHLAEDISKVRIEVPQMDDLPPLDFGPPSKQ